MKNFFKKTVAVVMALVMALSLFAVTAFAEEDPTHECYRQYDTYTVIGDSIACGYGLNTVDIGDWQVVDNPVNQLTMWQGELREGCYAQIVGDAIGAKTVNMMARESFTTANILRMIDPEYDAELSKPENYYDRFRSEGTSWIPKAYHYVSYADMKENAVDWIKNSDVITINLGNNDTFTQTLLALIFTSCYYTYGIPMEVALTAMKGDLQTVDSFDELFMMVDKGAFKGIINTLNDNIETYEKNYDRMMKRIRELNPDCEIYYLGMNNPVYYAEPQGSTVQQLASGIADDLGDELKTYVTETSEYKDEIIYVDCSRAETWITRKSELQSQLFSIYSPLMLLNEMINSHPNYNGHQYMANQIIDAMNEQGGQTKSTFASLTKGSKGWGVYNSDGSLRTSYTGLAQTKKGNVYYVRNGKLASSYTGIVKYKDKKYYIKKGKWQSSYNGTVTTKTKVYTVKSGIVTKETSR